MARQPKKTAEQIRWEQTCHPSELPEDHHRRKRWEEYLAFLEELPMRLFGLLVDAQREGFTFDFDRDPDNGNLSVNFTYYGVHNNSLVICVPLFSEERKVIEGSILSDAEIAIEDLEIAIERRRDRRLEEEAREKALKEALDRLTPEQQQLVKDYYGRGN